MKVVLLQEVAKVGHRHDVKNVADGFALNFLIPQGLAETATEKAVKRVEKIK
ncbi:MAG: 50S ribosomal protein L9, partial [Candidatus Taylorbacteria bacterium]|nr:50S ribosomal protein L9 [Candidatus Taylorbacteria bacterium]